MVALLALFIVAGHGYDIWQQREHWPFSFYPMYGRVQKRRTLQILALYAIVPNDTPGAKKKWQMVRVTDGKYVPPLNEVRIRNILMAAWGRDGATGRAQRATEAVLRDYLNLYEARRLKQLHDGPPMLEARLCRMTWRVRNGATRQKPESVESLMGVRADGKVIPYARRAAATMAASTQPDALDAAPDPNEKPPPPPDDNDESDDAAPNNG